MKMGLAAAALALPLLVAGSATAQIEPPAPPADPAAEAAEEKLPAGNELPANEGAPPPSVMGPAGLSEVEPAESADAGAADQEEEEAE